MAQSLEGLRVAILVENGFEQVEMTGPRQALDQAGARTTLISPVQGQVRAWQMKDWGDSFPADLPLGQARADDFDALLLPGGVMSPDKLRMNAQAMQFVRAFAEGGKPIAAICHGPWSLVEVNAVRGKTLTSWPSLRTDIQNAGGKWVDREVVRDGELVTSRKPDDIPAFNREMIGMFGEGTWSNRPANQRDLQHV